MSHSTGTGHAMTVAEVAESVAAGRGQALLLKMSHSEAARLEALQGVTGAKDRAATLGDAMRIYEALVQAKRDGGQPFIRYVDGIEVPVFKGERGHTTPPPIHDVAALAERLEAIALGVERGDRAPHSAGRELRVIAGKLREVLPW